MHATALAHDAVTHSKVPIYLLSAYPGKCIPSIPHMYLYIHIYMIYISTTTHNIIRNPNNVSLLSQLYIIHIYVRLINHHHPWLTPHGIFYRWPLNTCHVCAASAARPSPSADLPPPPHTIRSDSSIAN